MASGGEKSRRVLVIGGTGMLRGMTLALCARGETVTVVSRSAGRLADMGAASRYASGRLRLVVADWAYEAGFLAPITEVARREGPFNAAIVWIHGERLKLLLELARLIRPEGLLLHVRSSAAADPAGGGSPGHAAAWPCRYREVILGFAIHEGQSRWLTDQEISDGVLAALDRSEDRCIVGVVEPWSMRP